MVESVEEMVAQRRAAVASLESQRSVLGGDVVDTAIRALEQEIAQLQPEQQRKLATILFMDIADHTALIRGLDPEDNMEIIDQAIVRLEAPIVAAGGRITRATGDGFKAIFGHPVAHDNDPEMAVRAALNILEVTREYARELEERKGIRGFKTRIGIDTGLLLIGGVSEGIDTVKGESVNLAARLESQAPHNGILISGNTQRLVHGIFDLEATRPMQLKGFDEPVTAYQVLGLSAESFINPTRGVEGIDTPMIGRQEALDMLQSALKQVLEDTRAHMITVLGNAGLGKSRLMVEFEKSLPGGIELYKGRSMRERQDIPYAVFRYMFSRQLEIQETSLKEDIMRAFEGEIERVFGSTGDSAVRAHFIGQLLGFDFSGSPYLEGVLEDVQQLHDRAKNYLVEYFIAVTEARACVLFLEDIHWADDPSLNLTDQLVDLLKDRRLFILCNARPELLERNSFWSAMSPSRTIYRLPALSRLASRNLVREILNRAEVIPLLVQEFIVSGAEGNPFYIEELIKMLIENGIIQKDERTWQIEQTRLLELEVPPTLTGVIQARLDSLSALERTLLQQAAVIGRNFWDGILFSINATSGDGSPDPKIRAALEILLEKEMIQRHRKGAFAGVQEYSFKHALTREVTYESVLKRMRPVYHGLVAEWLIENSAEAAGQFTSMIAAHLEQAGQNHQAAAYFRRAGEASMKQYANQEAVHYLSRALELLPETAEDEQFNVLKARVQIFSLTGDRRRQKKDLIRLADLARSLGDDARLGETAMLQAMFASEQSHYHNIITHARRAIGHGESAGLPQLEGRAHQLWGRALISMGDYIEARNHLEKALQIARSEGHSQLEADSLRYLGSLTQNQGTPEDAEKLFQQSLEISQRSGDRRGELRALNNLGNLSLMLYSYEQGKAYFDRVLAISQEIGDRWGQAISNRAFGDIFRHRAEYRKASEFLSQAVLISGETGSKTLDMGARLNLGTVAMEKSDFAEAGRHFNDVLDLAQRIGNRQMEGRALREIGRFFLRQGDYIRAMNYYEQARLLFVKLDNKRSVTRVQTCIGALNLRLGNPNEALSELTAALRQIEGLNYPREKAIAMTQIGHVHRRLGKHRESELAYKEALALYESISETAMTVETLGGLAMLRLDAGDLARALEIAERLLNDIDAAEAGGAEPGAAERIYIPGLEGSTEPLEVGLWLFHILDAARDRRAAPLLDRLKTALGKQAAGIDDLDLQQAFINNIPAHREIMSSNAREAAAADAPFLRSEE